MTARQMLVVDAVLFVFWLTLLAADTSTPWRLFEAGMAIVTATLINRDIRRLRR